MKPGKAGTAAGAEGVSPLEVLAAHRDALTMMTSGAAFAAQSETKRGQLKAGFDAVAYRDGYTQIIASATIGAQDVMVGVSHTGTTETVADSLRLAREKGTTTIAITSDADGPLT